MISLDRNVHQHRHSHFNLRPYIEILRLVDLDGSVLPSEIGLLTQLSKFWGLLVFCIFLQRSLIKQKPPYGTTNGSCVVELCLPKLDTLQVVSSDSGFSGDFCLYYPRTHRVAIEIGRLPRFKPRRHCWCVTHGALPPLATNRT